MHVLPFDMDVPYTKRSKASTSAGRKSTRATTTARSGNFIKMPGVTEKRMNELLALLGVTDVERVSKCLKAAILKGYVRLEDPRCDPEGKWGLDQPLVDGKCHTCGKKITCHVRDVLYQPDYAGLDYGNGGCSATFRCVRSVEQHCDGIYITQMCSGKPSFDTAGPAPPYKKWSGCDLRWERPRTYRTACMAVNSMECISLSNQRCQPLPACARAVYTCIL